MGGANGEVRGRTKAEVYRRYRAEARKWEEAQDGDCIPDPGDKTECYEATHKDDDSGEFVLRYHFHT